jgi:response regulator RpfG family c-di-GMP phosphodiesterase
MNRRVLCVDDDSNELAGYQRNLRQQFDLETAPDGPQALTLLRNQGPFAVLIADMHMPGMNGLELLRLARPDAPDTVRFLLTSQGDLQTAIDAVNQESVIQFLPKPCPPEMLIQAIDLGLGQYQLMVANRELVEQTLCGSIRALVRVLSTIDPTTLGLGIKLREDVCAFAQTFHVERAFELELAALLSQIGFLTVPPAVLRKLRFNVSLTEEETNLILRVPKAGAALLERIPRLENIVEIIRCQHRHYDGTGEPADAPVGQGIPIGARILKVLLDLAQLEDRGFTRGQALQQMRNRLGWYDPDVLEVAYARYKGRPPVLVNACAA